MSVPSDYYLKDRLRDQKIDKDQLRDQKIGKDQLRDQRIGKVQNRRLLVKVAELSHKAASNQHSTEY